MTHVPLLMAQGLPLSTLFVPCKCHAVLVLDSGGRFQDCESASGFYLSTCRQQHSTTSASLVDVSPHFGESKHRKIGRRRNRFYIRESLLLITSLTVDPIDWIPKTSRLKSPKSSIPISCIFAASSQYRLQESTL